jgi:hypothetical protein
MQAPKNEGVQGARGVLPEDVRLMSGLQEYCTIEINDPGSRMVLDTAFFSLWIL